MLGRVKVKLEASRGKQHNMTIYIIEGEEEALLGQEDGVALGILKINERGDEEVTAAKPEEVTQQEVKLLREQLRKPTLEAAKVENKEGNVAKEPQQGTTPTDLPVAVGATAAEQKDGFAQKLLTPFRSKFLSAFKTVKEKVKEKFVKSKSLILERTINSTDEAKIDAIEDLKDLNSDLIVNAKKKDDVI